MDTGKYIDLIDQQHREMDAIYHSAAVRCGLSDTAFWVMYMLSITEGVCTQHDLVKQCCFPKQTVNTAVSGLVKQGYLTLEVISGTRNQKRLRLTEAGERLADRTGRAIRQAELRAYGAVSEEELSFYLELLKLLNANLRREAELL